MGKKTKVIKKVVKKSYLDLLIQKAELLDTIFDDGQGNLVVVSPDAFKEYDKIVKAWRKADKASSGESFDYLDSEEDYVEPKPEKAKK